MKACFKCGEEKPLQEFYRHKPLAVRWLCSACHTAWHQKNGEGKNVA